MTWPVRSSLVAMASGAAYEACSVVFVHQATHGTPMHTALASGLQAAASVAGIGASVKDWRVAPFFVLGYALGSYVAMVWA
jgi:hypothetical protein